jgi:hypothetical protein
VIVFHGMGQQVPFETIDAVARVLRNSAPAEACATAPAVTVEQVDLGVGRPVPRAEVMLQGDAQERRAVHVYEVYWAPLTEGKVGLRAVLAFLLAAGIAGVRVARDRAFFRWMFGGWKRFDVSSVPLLQLLLALAFVLSLVVMNAVIVAIGVTQALGAAPRAWPGAALMDDLTAAFAVFVLLVALAGSGLTLAYVLHARASCTGTAGDTGAPGEGWLALLDAITKLAMVAGIAIGAWIALDLLRDRLQLAPLGAWACAAGATVFCALRTWSADATLIVWSAVLVATLLIRGFVVQYVGDVAAYVESHRLNAFFEIRNGILHIARDLTHAVFTARAPDGEPAYERVVLVGHSLGSVVAYDTLNRLLLEDAWAHGALGVDARQKALITFGSPLDKTAFVFRDQKPVFSVVREALAAAAQPMISDPAVRERIAWTNLWSPRDWISGSLDYYDAPGTSASWAVRNEEDRAARIPLVAHVMYWRSPQLLAALLAALHARGL